MKTRIQEGRASGVDLEWLDRVRSIIIGVCLVVITMSSCSLPHGVTIEPDGGFTFTGSDGFTITAQGLEDARKQAQAHLIYLEEQKPPNQAFYDNWTGILNKILELKVALSGHHPPQDLRWLHKADRQQP